MASLIEAIDIKRKMFFEFENAPYHCIDVDISKPTARGGQTLVRIKMRNLLTRAVFDRTFKAGDKLAEPDLESGEATFLYADPSGYHFMDQTTYDTLTLGPDVVREDRDLLVDNVAIQIQKYNGTPIGLQFPPHVALTVSSGRTPGAGRVQEAAAASQVVGATQPDHRRPAPQRGQVCGDEPVGERRHHRGVVDGAGGPRRHGERWRHQARDARDRPRDPRPALHQGRRAGEGPHGDARVRRTSVKRPVRAPSGRPQGPPCLVPTNRC